MDWLSPRPNESFEFYRVAWPGYEERERYEKITGGSLEWSAFTDLKLSGSLDYRDQLPNSHDMVRVYYSFTNAKGESARIALATVRVEKPKPTRTPHGVSGSVTCHSMLKLLMDETYPMPFTVPAGTQAVAKAVELAKLVGLRVNNPDASAYVTKSSHTFDAGVSYLAIINWLLDMAGYASVTVDAYGALQILKYVEPTERPSSFDFAANETSIIMPEVSDEDDFDERGNVYQLYHDSQEESMWASASNVDIDDPLSVVNLGHRKCAYESVSEIAGETAQERFANLKAMAVQKVKNSSVISYRTIKHQWVPILPNDAVTTDLEDGNGAWGGNVTNVQMELDIQALCQTKVRKFVRYDLKIETEGAIVYAV
ncbi:hypothetical protein [Gordonibacter sp.]|uniref:hypothetical protein n=2 Tax=Gordonibacter sp. TaxID=1968902 RepID=UPI002FC9D248